MTISASIYGCSGLVLTADETAFFKDAQPWGFILFRRNIATPEQVRALCAELRAVSGRVDTPILIDQEGGRVQRLGPPHWQAYPPARAYADIFSRDSLIGRELTRLGARLIAHDLISLGITVDCLPVLDVRAPDSSAAVIGDRSYGEDWRNVAILGRAAAEGLLAGGVLPVMKHIPGHGRAKVDSHERLPTVESSCRELATVDFAPFRALSDMPAAMTAHVVYLAIDKHHPATVSRRILKTVVRREIGFDGLLMSDDLSMHALSGTLRERAAAAIAAGCDIALHCNGDMAEMRQVAEAAPVLAGVAQRRARAALACVRHEPEPLDRAFVQAQFDAHLRRLL